MIPMTRTSTRAVTLGDHLIHETIAQPRTLASEKYPLATACHTTEVSLDMILNPEGQPLRITCAYCINELRATARMKEVMAADLTAEQYEAIRERHKAERKQRARPLGPLRAWASFNIILREAGLR